MTGSPNRRELIAGSLAGVGLLAAAPALAQALPEPDEPDAAIDTARGVFEHVTVPVRLNGQGPFRFMVDTGANISCLSQDLADRVGLPAGRNVTVQTIVGRRERRTVQVDRLEVGPRVRRRVNTPGLPMLDFGVDGILGIDWLKGQRLEMAFKNGRLQITKSRSEASVEGKVVVPARRRSGQLTIVDADVSGATISAMIDSGSQFSLGNRALRRLVNELDPTAFGRSTPVSMVSIVGEAFAGDQLFVPFIRLGGLTLGNVPVVFAEMPVFKLWELHDKPAMLLGVDLLAQFETVAMDFGRSAVRFDIGQA